jgi:transcription termination factor Rho
MIFTYRLLKFVYLVLKPEIQLKVRPPKEGRNFFPLVRVLKINGHDPSGEDRVSFEHLTPVFPSEKFKLAERQSTISTRILICFRL